MGRRGPRPQPSALKKAKGTYRPCRAPKNEIKPALGVPEYPANLDEVAGALWLSIAPELERLGILAKIDRTALEGFCANYSSARKYQAIADDDPMIETFYGVKVNPAAGAARHHWGLVRQFASEFGLTPSARTRINGSGTDDAKDPADDFLFGKTALHVVPGGVGGGGNAG